MGIGELVEGFQRLKDKYRRHALVALAFLLVVLLFGASIKPVLVVVLFIILGSFSTFYHNYFRSPVNFELVKLFTIVGSVAYGSSAGIIIGVPSVIIGRALSGRLDQDTLTSIAAMVLIAVLASMFRTADITVIGIMLVVVYYVVISPFIVLFGENRGYEAVYILTNIIFNMILFIKIAPLLLNWI
ncbi:hypothetical protein HYU11_01600 [Candidatus Woesearchaeota archaeon]|nr:hypothetical protein [Candidatus Woesearchaeota archaeon]